MVVVSVSWWDWIIVNEKIIVGRAIFFYTIHVLGIHHSFWKFIVQNLKKKFASGTKRSVESCPRPYLGSDDNIKCHNLFSTIARFYNTKIFLVCRGARTHVSPPPKEDNDAMSNAIKAGRKKKEIWFFFLSWTLWCAIDGKANNLIWSLILVCTTILSILNKTMACMDENNMHYAW